MNVFQKILHERKTKRMEGELDFFLTLLAMELSLKQPLEKALLAAAQGVREPLRSEMVHCVETHRAQGAPLEMQLRAWKEKWKSPLIYRVAGVLIQLHVQGVSSPAIQGLRYLAEDVRATQRNALRAFSSALAMWSIVFIGVSTLVPTLFLGFVSVGSGFLELSLTPLQIWGVSVVAIPLANALILGIVWLQSPVGNAA